MTLHVTIDRFGASFGAFAGPGHQKSNSFEIFATWRKMSPREYLQSGPKLKNKKTGQNGAIWWLGPCSGWSLDPQSPIDSPFGVWPGLKKRIRSFFETAKYKGGWIRRVCQFDGLKECFEGLQGSIEVKHCDWIFQTRKTTKYKAINELIKNLYKLQNL